MANNIVTALNTAVENGAANSVAANASAGNVTANAANASAAAAPAPPWIPDFCDAYGDRLLQLGVAFLLLALLLGVASAVIALWKEWKKKEPGNGKGGQRSIGDPPKFIEALTGLINALAMAPAWFALFLGGALLLYMAGSLAGEVCVPGGDDSNGNAVSTNQTRSASRPSGSNTQVPVNGVQPAVGNGSGTKSGR